MKMVINYNHASIKARNSYRRGAVYSGPDAVCIRSRSSFDDLIDLGKPRSPRRSAPAPHRLTTASYKYKPNPRLYPGPQPKTKTKGKKKGKGANGTGDSGRSRRRKRPPRSIVPNERLYKPPATRARVPTPPPPPPPRPRRSWTPPHLRAPIETASHVALRLAEQRAQAAARQAWAHQGAGRARAEGAGPESPRPESTRTESTRTGVARLPAGGGPRLVVTLPGGPPAPRYRPRSQHFRLRSLQLDSRASSPAPAARLSPLMAAPRAPATPEDGSDTNDPHSAPSEYLAEFLSAILQRQYAEALKYCRLILQYEPHNATARGFCPLLQHKLGLRPRRGHESGRGGSSSSEASGSADGSGSEGESGSSCASLSLDSSARSWRSARGDSSASPASPAPLADDNGNTPSIDTLDADIENDNASSDDCTALMKDVTLQQLRAQFACSIK